MKLETFILAVILVLSFVALRVPASAAVEISRPIVRDTTWTCLDTIKVTRSVIVSATGRLTIQAGAVILFSPGTGLLVQGQLRANGERDKCILFTCIADTAGGSPQAGQWNGLRFLPNSTGSVRHCDIRFARNGVRIDQSSVTFYGCAIADFSARGIFINGSKSDPPVSTIIEHCRIRQNDTELIGSGVGILAYRSAHVTLSRCEVSKCRYGVEFGATQAKAPQFLISGCTIRDHALYGIYIPPVG